MGWIVSVCCFRKTLPSLGPPSKSLSIEPGELSHSQRKKEMATQESPPPGTSSAMRNAFGTVLSALILLLIGVLAFSIRLFSVSSLSHPSPSPLIYSIMLVDSRSDLTTLDPTILDPISLYCDLIDRCSFISPSLYVYIFVCC